MDQAAGQHICSGRDQGRTARIRRLPAALLRQWEEHLIAVNGNKKIVPLPAAGVPQDEASWSADGTQIVFVQGPTSAGQLVWLKANQQGAQPVPLTGPGADDHDHRSRRRPQDLLAFIDDSGGGSKLCFAVVGPNQLNPACTSHPGWTLGRQVAWSPDGAKILVLRTKNGTNRRVFGLIEFATTSRSRPRRRCGGRARSSPTRRRPARVSAAPGQRKAGCARVEHGHAQLPPLITGPDLNLRNSTTFAIRAAKWPGGRMARSSR